MQHQTIRLDLTRDGLWFSHSSEITTLLNLTPFARRYNKTAIWFYRTTIRALFVSAHSIYVHRASTMRLLIAVPIFQVNKQFFVLWMSEWEHALPSKCPRKSHTAQSAQSPLPNNENPAKREITGNTINNPKSARTTEIRNTNKILTRNGLNIPGTRPSNR